MYCLNIKLVIIVGYCFNELSSIQHTTLSVKQRVAILRKQIEDEIRQKSQKIQPIEENDSFEENEYDHDRLLMTPIIIKKKKEKTTPYITSQMTPVKNAAFLPTIKADDSTPLSPLRYKKRKINKIAKNISHEMNIFSVRKPVEIFYRRLLDESEMNKEVKWVHCQELITPYLRGMKKELTHREHLTPKSPVVRRFIHLLTLNTTMYTKEDIFSVLYQISTLQLRLFHWDIPAITLLFNILMKEKKHTFSNLKYAIQSYFDDWRLDISNTSNLLYESRLFRPPCIKISDSTGSTKAKKFTTYPKKMKLKLDCDSTEDPTCTHGPD